MIGNDDLIRAWEDVDSSGAAAPKTVEGGLAMVRSTEVDPVAALRISQRGARHVMDCIEGDESAVTMLGLAVMTGLLVGVRAGRADAIRLTEEFSRDE